VILLTLIDGDAGLGIEDSRVATPFSARIPSSINYVLIGNACDRSVAVSSGLTALWSAAFDELEGRAGRVGIVKEEGALGARDVVLILAAAKYVKEKGQTEDVFFFCWHV
jgi:hypothetical protein